MQSTKQPEEAAALPTAAQIEPVGQCNLRCVMCLIRFRRDGLPPGPPAYMRVSLFKDLIEQLPGVTDLHMQGLGEPLLHPDFFDMVAHAAARGKQVSTNSNLTLLGRERAEACVRSGLAWMRISLDGATAGTYDGIRSGSRLSLVLENLELLREAKERAGSLTPRLFLVMVVMRRNIHELNDVIRLAHHFSLEQVFVQHLCSDLSGQAAMASEPLMRDFIEAESLVTEDPGRIEKAFRNARALARELDIELRLPVIGAPFLQSQARQAAVRLAVALRVHHLGRQGDAVLHDRASGADELRQRGPARFPEDLEQRGVPDVPFRA